jgi:hypothetical protein
MTHDVKVPEENEGREAKRIDSPTTTPDASRSSDANSERAARSQLAHELTAIKRRERTHQKLLIGIAMERYRYDPTVARSRVAMQIADDLRRQGISIDEDTVRAHLQAAREVLDDT